MYLGIVVGYSIVESNELEGLGIVCLCYDELMIYCEDVIVLVVGFLFIVWFGFGL